VEAPTCGPRGPELTGRSLHRLFLPDTLEEIRSFYRALELDRPAPRLETILDVVRRIYGLEPLVDLLSDLRDPEPNRLHRFFGKHLELSGTHITANFDACLERCIPAAAASRLFHFHGSLADDPTGAALGATLAQVQRGFPEEIAVRLEGLLAGAATIVFVGYSGSDFFDVDPFLERAAHRRLFTGQTVIWVDHDPSSSPLLASDSANPLVGGKLDLFRNAGATCRLVTGRTAEFLDTLARRWGWEALGPEGTGSNRWRAAFSPTQAQRRRASLELYATMGLHRAVRRLLDERPATTADELVLAGHTAWAEGRYEEAWRSWRRGYTGPGLERWAARVERRGSCLWTSGRFLRAYWVLRRAILRARRERLEGEPLWLLGEALARAVMYMERRPDTKLMVTSKMKAFALGAVPDPDAPSDGYASLGPHLDARFRSVRARLGAAPAIHDFMGRAVTTFVESEALGASLNYRYGSLRDATSPTSADPAEYRRLERAFDALGALGDAARVPFLPGAERAYSCGEAWRALRVPDLARLHRLMLFGDFAVRRLRLRLRERRRG
jgi:hypothetical protein